MLGYAGLAVTIEKIIKAGMDEEAMYKRLESSVKAVGVSYASVSPMVQGFIADITKTTQFGDEKTVPVLQEITQLTGSLQKGFQGTKTALDIAASGLMDIDTAGRLVAMAMTGNVEMLGRYIPALRASSGVINDNMSASEKAAVAMEILNKMFGGQAQANLGTFSGKVNQIKNYLGDMVEAVGQVAIDKLSPTIEKWRTKIIEFVESGKFEEWLGRTEEKIGAFFKKVEQTFNWMVAHKDTIAAVFSAAAVAVLVVEIGHLAFGIKNAVEWAIKLGGAFGNLAKIPPIKVPLTVVGVGAAAAFTATQLVRLVDSMIEADKAQKALDKSTELYASTSEKARAFIEENSEKLKSLGITFKAGPGGSIRIDHRSINDEFKQAGKDAWESFRDGLSGGGGGKVVIDDEWLKVIEESQAKSTWGKSDQGAARVKAQWESQREAVKAYYEAVKFEDWNYMQYRTALIDQQTAAILTATGNELMAEKFKYEQMKRLAEEYEQSGSFVGPPAPKPGESDADISKKYQVWASAFENSFRAAAEVVQSEFSQMWDKVFGKANSVIQKMAKTFVSVMVSAIMEVAAKEATLWILKAIFPATGATGIFEKLLGFAHEGAYIPRYHEGAYVPRMHGGSLRDDEYYAIYQRGEYVMPKESVTSRTLPVLNQIRQTGSTGGQNVSVNIAGDEIVVDGVIDTKTLDDVKTFLADRDLLTAEGLEKILKGRKVSLAI